MGEYETVMRLAANVEDIIRSSYGSGRTSYDIAQHIHAREKALHKIIASLIVDVDARLYATRFVSMSAHVIKATIPTGLMAAVSPEIQIEGDGGDNIAITVRRY